MGSGPDDDRGLTVRGGGGGVLGTVDDDRRHAGRGDGVGLGKG